MKNRYRFDKEEHLHLLDEKPLTGTSSVTNVLSKNLVWWSAELAAVECLEAGEQIPSIREEYEAAVVSGDKKSAIDALQKKYPLFKKARYAHFATLKEKAKSGTDLHEVLERFVKSEMGKQTEITEEEAKLIQPYIDWSRANVKRYIASEAHCFDESQDMFVGGITDAVAELTNGMLVVIDFKSSKEAYKNQAIQGAGYAIQIDRNGLFSEDGEHELKLDKPIDAIMIVPFGAAKLEPVIFRDIDAYKKAFKAAVVLYRILFNHED